MGAYRETHEDMAREAETRASFYRTLASLYFKELDQAGIDALSNEDLTATGVDARVGNRFRGRHFGGGVV